MYLNTYIYIFYRSMSNINGPVEKMPFNLISKFTLNNTIPVVKWYIDGTNELLAPKWTNDYLNSFFTRFTRFNILNNIHGNEPYGIGCLYERQGGASYYLCKAFDNYDIINSDIAVIGSTTPWIEAILFNYGCKNITTVDYNIPEVDNILIKTLLYSDFDININNNKYDIIVSYSSIEHSGLGRYGDILDPEGDLKTLDCIYNNLKDNGILILGIPICKDILVWNAHRIYGKIRLFLLLKNFEIIKWYGGNESCLDGPNVLMSNAQQPIIVCKKKL